MDRPVVVCTSQGDPTPSPDIMCSDILMDFSRSCSYGTEIVSTNLDCDNGILVFAGWFICSPAYCNNHYVLYWEKVNMVRIKQS